jgi:hypothetical protein
MPINYPNLIEAINSEKSRLQQARNLLAGIGTGTATRKRKRTLSAEARARISAAQKKRWAQQKRAAKR